jgi:hypothetical protein
MTVDVLIAALAVLAPLLNGATQLWAQSLIVLGFAVLLWLSPPEQPLPGALTAMFLALAALAFVGLLPAGWFPELPWRRVLTGELSLQLAPTLSPQPWVSLEQGLLFCAGVAWAWWLSARSWHASRRALLEAYAWGVLALVIVAFVLWFARRAPGSERLPVEFGFFPNRNQTANVFALGGVIMLALAIEGIWHHHRGSIFWLGGVVLVAAALGVVGSRAGVLLFGGGGGAWLVWAVIKHRRRGRWLGFAAAGGLLLLAGFFLFGGRAADRFRPVLANGEPSQGDLRLAVQSDALGLARDASWHGVGLGNFEVFFARYRDRSVNFDFAQHPESDWLWLACELGWVAALLAAGIAGWLLARCWPFEHGSEALLRSAAWLCGVLFLIHGFVDVSGHRMGAVWPALFLAGVAGHARWGGGHSRATVAAARGLAVVFGVLALTGLASTLPGVKLPTSGYADAVERRLNAALAQTNLADIVQLTTEGMRTRPLRWEYYYHRAMARAVLHPATGPALADFRVLHFLDPRPQRAVDEGRVWLWREWAYREEDVWIGREPELALAAWRTALANARGDTNRFYDLMLYWSRGFPEMREGLRELAADEPKRWLGFLGWVSPGEFMEELNALLARDAALARFTLEERRQILALWNARGDRAALEAALQRNPEWLPAGWRWLAEAHARRKEFVAACTLAGQFAPKTEPPLIESKSLAAAQREFKARPRDFVAGFALYQALIQNGDTDEALSVLTQLTSLANAPRYFHQLEAGQWSRKQQWEKAWAAWARFLK